VEGNSARQLEFAIGLERNTEAPPEVVSLAPSMAELKSIPALILISGAAVVVSAADDTRTETAYDGHVTLEVPIEWHEIPEVQLELNSLNTVEMSGGRIAELYRHGYRPGDPESEVELPQILIQIRESGRLNYRHYLHLPPAHEIRRTHGSPVESLELDDAYFDHSRFLLRLTNTLGIERSGSVTVLSASFLTERGMFTLHCYTYSTQATVVAPIFERVVDSVRFDDELQYRPRFGDRWPPRPSTLAFSAAAVLILIVLVVEIRRRRRFLS
jgi:hypothetical protein